MGLYEQLRKELSAKNARIREGARARLQAIFDAEYNEERSHG